jgi:hypothetical protein
MLLENWAVHDNVLFVLARLKNVDGRKTDRRKQGIQLDAARSRRGTSTANVAGVERKTCCEPLLPRSKVQQPPCAPLSLRVT